MDMEFAMPFVFLGLAVVGFVEAKLSSKWNLPYFKSGIPVFRQSRQTASAPSTTIDAGRLELLIPASKYPKLVFRKAGSGVFAFRDEYSRFFAGYTGIGWYQPVMHGTLNIDPARAQIEVIGRLNWSPLIFGAVAVPTLLVYGSPDWFLLLVWALLAFMYAASAATYIIQRKRFAQVANLVAEHVSALS